MATERKLTISQLKNYLGTGLKIRYNIGKLQFEHVLGKSNTIGNIDVHSAINLQAKLICYRLQDLDKFIPELGFVPLEKLHDKYDLLSVNVSNKSIGVLIDTCDYSQKIDFIDSWHIMQKLFEWHFWVFDQEYFEQGLIINKLK